MRKGTMIAVALTAVATAAAIVLVSSVEGEPEALTEIPGGDPSRGQQLVTEYGCISCHTIPDTESTDKYVGPPLDEFPQRRYIAGDEPNTPEVLIRWIQDPQSIEPGTVMPDLGVDYDDARDIAAFLYSDP